MPGPMPGPLGGPAAEHVGRGAAGAACYVVRHGQSSWNLRGLTQGQQTTPRLTALGRAQARTAAAMIAADLGMRGGAVETIRSSDLRRARQTAGVVHQLLGGRLSLDTRLREQHLGHLEGRPYAESWAAAETHDWSDPDLPVAGGESPRSVQERMAAAFADVDHASVSVLVSHGDAIRALLAHLARVSPVDPAHPVETATDTGDAEAWVPVANGAVARIDDGGVHWLAP